ncbi:MAG TPA: winged helix-turn-helix domain-containing protein [Bryobacteraceae bacterium]|nr:winged helix-turn-helix domain-containing protein [Bryobacteraceae bacterium]
MTQPQPGPIHSTGYKDNHLTVNFEREVAYLDGTPMKLTFKAYSLLAFLVRHPGELVPREELLLLVWGYTSEVRTRTLDVHVRRLRKSLGSYGVSYIETIFGVGYRFQPYRATARNEAPAVTSLRDAEPGSQWRMAAGTAQ